MKFDIDCATTPGEAFRIDRVCRRRAKHSNIELDGAVDGCGGEYHERGVLVNASCDVRSETLKSRTDSERWIDRVYSWSMGTVR